MTTPVATHGPTMQGTLSQQGFTQGFPASLGIEQYLGQPQNYGGFPQQSHTQSQFQSQFPQIVQSLVSQLLPIAQQVILPQVTATAIQQIQVYLHQLVTQQVNSQFGQPGGWQQPQFGQLGGWQQPQSGRSYQGIY